MLSADLDGSADGALVELHTSAGELPIAEGKLFTAALKLPTAPEKLSIAEVMLPLL